MPRSRASPLTLLGDPRSEERQSYRCGIRWGANPPQPDCDEQGKVIRDAAMVLCKVFDELLADILSQSHLRQVNYLAPVHR